MRTVILALVSTLALILGGTRALGVQAASPSASSVTREVIKLDAMSGSKNVATAIFVYDHKKNLTTVTLMASRLQPKSAHPAAIHLGRCTSFRASIVHSFPTLHADSKGNATATTTFKGPVSHDKWYVAIHQGPTLKSKGGSKLVACGNVT